MEERIIQGDCLDALKTLPDCSVDMCVTSPPYYGLRDYGTGTWIGGDPNCPHKRLSKWSDKITTGHHQSELIGNVGDAIYKTVCPLCGAVREDKQIGLEETPEEYVQKLVSVFREVRRVLKDDGTLWLNIGDSYAGGQGRWGRWGGTDDMSNKQVSNNGSIGQIGKTKKWNHEVIKPKDLIGIPWMLAFALREDGWYLRQDIIWAKPNPMPESVKDRCTKSHEYLFLLSKSPKYYFDHEAIQEEAKWADDKRALGERVEYEGKRSSGKDVKAQKDFCAFSHKNLQYNGQQNNTMHERRAEGLPDIPYVVRNKRDVWTVVTRPIKDAHFATYPEELIEPCILAGSRSGGVVLDPFFGSGTTGRVAIKHGRGYIGIELNPEYIDIEKKRLNGVQTTLF